MWGGDVEVGGRRRSEGGDEDGDKEESSIFKSSFSFNLLVLFIVYNLFYIIDVL